MSSQALIAWRTRLGVSQRKAAELLGCSLRSITNYEKDDATVPLTIGLACAALEAGLKPIK